MMSHQIVMSLTCILGLGVTAQWLAWRFKLSPVLLLLFAGILVGPVMGFIQPENLFGDLLFPGVSLAVALILFEGGLSLKLSELSEFGRPVLRLLSVGVLLTWVGVALLAYGIFALPMAESILLGAILTVTGPTVIQPLLRHSRPTHAARTILNWEGIVIDPIGAMLAVIVYEAMHAGLLYSAPILALTTVASMVFWGLIWGGAMAFLIMVFLRQFWLPDALHSPLSLVAVLTAFTLANGFVEEAGLIAVTVMGLILANQKLVDIHHIVHFKENIRVLLLSSLFVVLAARLDLTAIWALGFQGVLFVLGLILLVRPVSVILSLMGTEIKLNERLYIGWMAPRGIVAAAVSSILAIKLQNTQMASDAAMLLEPITYAVITGTVIVYSLTSSPVARLLKVQQKKPNGMLLVGASDWARDLGLLLNKLGIPVAFVDSNRKAASLAKLNGVPVYYGSVISEALEEVVDFEKLGMVLAMTSNDEINTLACMKLQPQFGRSGVYQLTPGRLHSGPKTKKFHGRYLFSSHLGFETLQTLYDEGFRFKTIQGREFFLEQMRMYDDKVYPLFAINANDEVTVISTDQAFSPTSVDHTLIALVPQNVYHIKESYQELQIKYRN